MARLTKPRKKSVRVSRRTTGMAAMPVKNSSWEKCQFYVHYSVESREWTVAVKEYIARHYSRVAIAAINKVPDCRLGMSSGWATAAWLLLNGHPELVHPDWIKGLPMRINRLIEEGSIIKSEVTEDGVKKRNAYVPTIQERIHEQSQDACEAIEEWLEGFITNRKNFNPKGFDFISHFSNMKVSQAHARKIKGFYASELEEVRLIQKLPTPQQISKIINEREKDHALQLREGYSHITKNDAVAYLVALETLTGACDMIIDVAKATRIPKIKKVPSKEKRVAGVKYLDKDEKLQIVSVSPLELINATEIWAYNVKTRKLYKIVADKDSGVMNVKGTTIIGYDEELSVGKTLRNPAESLKEFKNSGKIKLRKFLEDIKTVPIKFNGRINSDTLLLKINN